MSPSVRQIADAVMYEGYMLYPYRASSVKNRQRWTFGGLYPARYVAHTGNASSFESQLLVLDDADGDRKPEIEITVRFLHLMRREDGLDVGVPREVSAGEFAFDADAGQLPIRGSVDLSVERVSRDLHRITIRVRNLTDVDDPLALMASTHAIASVKNGNFISLTDPPREFVEEASRCANRGVWPVLTGDARARDTMLISPIILSDYPQIAPESAGDLFDGSEIDEILSLRILTLTDAEKDEIRATDSHTRRVLERTESLSPEAWMSLHGALRNPHALQPCGFRAGDRVRLRPRKSGDIMDIALAGKIAQIDTVEVDYEQRVHIAVVLEDDPGRDLGAMKQPGHRFFFSPEEVEAVS